MALKGIKVIELAGLAPVPFCGMILSDFGATVIRVDKAGTDMTSLDCLGNGKKSIGLNLKDSRGKDILKRLCNTSDVLIEPFRRGVMEKLGLGPEVITKENPKLIYARLTGFGQSGPFSPMAGHDINYVAMSGVLSFLGRKNENPMFPVNLLADFGGGGLTCALGIVMALFERNKSGLGQVVDTAMSDGTAYLGSWLYRGQNLPIWGQERGGNILDSGAHFYETYKTKDNKCMSVGALEPQFYHQFVEKLGISDLPQYNDFESKKKLIADIFATKTRSEWCDIFDGTDACVAPVLDGQEVADHPHNKERNSFIKLKDGTIAPQPAPVLSRTPGVSCSVQDPPTHGQHTREVLAELGYSDLQIEEFGNECVVDVNTQSKL